MDRATSWMNSQRQELDNEQMAYERLVKKLEVIEDEIYQGQISSHINWKKLENFGIPTMKYVIVLKSFRQSKMPFCMN